MEGGRPRIDGNGMTRPDELGKIPLELFHPGPGRDPTAAENFRNGLDFFLLDQGKVKRKDTQTATRAMR